MRFLALLLVSMPAFAAAKSSFIKKTYSTDLGTVMRQETITPTDACPRVPAEERVYVDETNELRERWWVSKKYKARRVHFRPVDGSFYVTDKRAGYVVSKPKDVDALKEEMARMDALYAGAVPSRKNCGNELERSERPVVEEKKDDGKVPAKPRAVLLR